MKSKHILIALCAFCVAQMTFGQSSNSTSMTGGIMNQFNSWISRLRGNHPNSEKDKGKEEKEKNNHQQQRPPQPMRFPGMVPFQVMPGVYGQMTPMGPVAFAPRPITGAGMGMPQSFGSIAADSSIAPNFGMAPIDPSAFSVGSASHILPHSVHHSPFGGADLDYGHHMGNLQQMTPFGGGGFSGHYTGQPSYQHHMSENTFHHSQPSGDSGNDDYSGYNR